jgi:hypothetical protein
VSEQSFRRHVCEGEGVPHFEALHNTEHLFAHGAAWGRGRLAVLGRRALEHDGRRRDLEAGTREEQRGRAIFGRDRLLRRRRHHRIFRHDEWGRLGLRLGLRSIVVFLLFSIGLALGVVRDRVELILVRVDLLELLDQRGAVRLDDVGAMTREVGDQMLDAVGDRCLFMQTCSTRKQRK